MSAPNQHTYDIADVLPGDSAEFSGTFGMDGEMSLRCTNLSTPGDLYRADLEFGTVCGDMQFSVLGRDHYFVDWGTYHFRRGLRFDACLEQPSLQLTFQLEGTTHSVRNPMGLDFSLRVGDTNFVYAPSVEGVFEVEDDLRGSTFEVLLSHVYFVGLAERYPHLFGDCMERTIRNEPFFLSEHHLHITPAMLGVIQRIRRCDVDQVAGSLFLEAQILELIALQFAQLEQPIARNGHALSGPDVDRIHQARQILLDSLSDPPTLAEFAREAGTNEYALNRGFNALFGTSPYAYLLDHKLELARSYVVDTDLTIAEIAYRVGYSDPAHLTNAFRKQYGHPPSTLR